MEWEHLDEFVLLRCLCFIETREIGRLLQSCDAWSGLGRRKDVWALLLERHGWRKRLRSRGAWSVETAEDDGEWSDGDVPESMGALSALSGSSRSWALRESNGAESSSGSESEDEDATERFRRRFMARWARWVPFAREMAQGMESFLFAARPFCERHGIVAQRARRRLRSATTAEAFAAARVARRSSVAHSFS